VFEGKFRVVGSILIDGKFQGEIDTEGQLVVGKAGKVKTDIKAKKVTVSGILIGNIHATEEVQLSESGMVLGNIETPRLLVEEGVVTHGEVTITGQKSDDITKTIQDAFGKDAEDEIKVLLRQKKTAPARED